MKSASVLVRVGDSLWTLSSCSKKRPQCIGCEKNGLRTSLDSTQFMWVMQHYRVGLLPSRGLRQMQTPHSVKAQSWSKYSSPYVSTRAQDFSLYFVVNFVLWNQISPGSAVMELDGSLFCDPSNIVVDWLATWAESNHVILISAATVMRRLLVWICTAHRCGWRNPLYFSTLRFIYLGSRQLRWYVAQLSFPLPRSTPSFLHHGDHSSQRLWWFVLWAPPDRFVSLLQP
jgi:hypothetical protein